MFILRRTFPLVAVLAATALSAQARPTALPMDPAVRVGTLPNGLRYYIRKNSRPEKRLELRLVVNAGSVLEDDDQRGMAHFVEHMLFNGTRRFKKNDIVSYLESIGVRFGADLNAQTGFDETMYILPVPTDKPGLVERAFDILEDWASAATFDSLEVVAERGVVLEEWRGGLGADSRIRDQQFPVIFQGSRYADRLPIGLPEILRGANPAPLKRFYRDWYRPNLMAVVAVGDADPARIERLIRARFGRLRNPARPRPRPATPVPANAAPLVSIATDAEEQVASVGVLFKHAPSRLRTRADYRRSLVEGLYNAMFNARLGELSRRGQAPFSVASSGYGSFVRGTDAYQLNAVAKDGRTREGLLAVLAEARRVREHGFLESELARVRAATLRSYESAFDDRATTESAEFTGEYVDHFLTGEPSPGIDWEFRTVKELLPGIRLDEVNQVGRRLITDSNRVVVLSAPARDSAALPTKDALLSTFAEAERTPVIAWTEEVGEGALVPSRPTPGRITNERTIAAIGVTEWTLSNGIRVLLKPTDFKADEVILRGWSPGGTSLIPDRDLPSAALATTIVERGGVSTFDAIALSKKLAGVQAQASTSIDGESEGVSGAASPKDLATLFELTHARLTAPRRDSAAFAAFRAQVEPFLANRGTSPEAAFSDTIQLTLAQHHPRVQPTNVAFLRQVDFNRAIEIYRDRFADFSDYTFVVVGAFSLAQVRPLVEQWLATLPATNRKETWKDVGVLAPKGELTKVVRKGVEPKAQTLVVYQGPAMFSPAERHALRSLTEYLEMRLLEQLREALGGTYSVSVSGGLQRVPREEFSISIQFGSAPARADSLYAAIQLVIAQTLDGTITDADIAKIREQQQRAQEVSLRENSYWLANLAARVENGEELENILRYSDFIRALTPAQVQQAARRYLSSGNVARFVLLPEPVAK
ncbi:MAG: insulinase family protein [Gemmatimonadetes bacterium]|nr:insulinase family protein [Gemmatimonadota bacterium]